MSTDRNRRKPQQSIGPHLQICARLHQDAWDPQALSLGDTGCSDNTHIILGLTRIPCTFSQVLALSLFDPCFSPAARNWSTQDSPDQLPSAQFRSEAGYTKKRSLGHTQGMYFKLNGCRSRLGWSVSREQTGTLCSDQNCIPGIRSPKRTSKGRSRIARPPRGTFPMDQMLAVIRLSIHCQKSHETTIRRSTRAHAGEAKAIKVNEMYGPLPRQQYLTMRVPVATRALKLTSNHYTRYNPMANIARAIRRTRETYETPDAHSKTFPR